MPLDDMIGETFTWIEKTDGVVRVVQSGARGQKFFKKYKKHKHETEAGMHA